MYRLLAVFALVSCAVADTILVPDNIDGRIVGGVDTTIQDHPYQVSVQNGSGFHLCGGSIISKDIVVTAAHCLVRYKPDEFFKVRLGSTSHNEGGLLVHVKDYRTHKSYNYRTKDYDVAVIKLATPVYQSTTIRYIKLAQSAPPTGTFAVATGWGIKSIYSNKPSKILQKVEVEIIDREICANKFSYGNQIKSSMFCAYAVGKDTCTGDSGGPLVVGNELVGIVSFGIGCASEYFPGLYINVAKVHEWIENTAQEL